jgi:fatty-acyl-CoA synthase
VNKRGGWIADLALAVGLVAPLLVVLGAVGTKLGVWSWRVGFVKMTVQWAPPAAIAGVALGAVALLVALFVLKRKRLVALAALVLPGLVLAGMAKLKADAGKVPPIHDVATTWDDPVMFTKALMSERAGADNPVEADPRVPAKAGPPWAGQRIADVNAKTCPGARTIPRQVDSDAAVAAIEKLGGRVVGSSLFRVEGTFESFWYGFKDDVAIRIRPGETDIRSVSRVGGSDIGMNCKRVTALVQALSK